MSYNIEMLTVDRLTELWPVLRSMVLQSCSGNELSKDEVEPEDIFVLASTGMMTMFVGFEELVPKCMLAIQFTEVNGHKCATITGLAGANLNTFKRHYWATILEWLRANGVEWVDALASPRLAKVLLGKYGFTKSAVQVRMDLRG